MAAHLQKGFISMKKLLVSAPPPTANGDLHLGHLSGPFLRADILYKYSKMRGREVYCINGADEHQSYVAFMAEKLHQTPLETVDRFSEAIRKTFQAARCDFDVFLRPSRSPAHQKFAQQIFKTLYDNGKFITREAPALYCKNCEQFLFEVYVLGKCPHCGAASCGNACEGCGRPNSCIDLKEAVCNRCGAVPTTRTSRRLYFPLSTYEQQLRSYYESVVMNPRLRSICEVMLADGLPDIVMGHPADWGIPVPIPGFEDQRIYVWFEVAVGLLAASQQLSEKLDLKAGWKEFWRTEDVDVVQFCGFDNGYFYAMLIPALLLAYDPQIKLAEAILLNEFYYLDGSKFSTSRNHAIWCRELLERVPLDTVRFYLALSGPETEPTNFTIKQYEETIRRELISGWQGWLRELGTKLDTEYDGVAPSARVLTNEQHEFTEKLKGFMTEATSAYEPANFSPRRAASVVVELGRATRDFCKAEDQRRNGSRENSRPTTVALELAAANTLAILSGPIMPGFSARLWRDLGNEMPVSGAHWEESPQWVPGGTRISHLDQPYFANF